jgi:hypothetical protein
VIAVILQPSYIPWRGTFDQIRRADTFVFYDDVQYDKHGWRNRNQIKTAQGRQWLTIPVHSGGATLGRPITEVRIDWSKPWARSHHKALTISYGKAPFFRDFGALLDSIYNRSDEYIADFTIETTIQLAQELGIKNTRFVRSSELHGVTGRKTERLIQILGQLGATHYISGPSAREYIEAAAFAEAGITLEYMRYEYPAYPQLHPPFDPNVSVLDLLFMTGAQAMQYIVGPELARNES